MRNKNSILCLAKVKFDLRDPDEFYFAQREIDSLLGTKTKFVKTIASLIKEEPFNLLDDEVVHLITRLVYMGEGQGSLAEMPVREIVSIVKRATFFKEIYVILEADSNEMLNLLNEIGVVIKSEQLENKKIDPNPYTQIFLKNSLEQNKLVTIRFLPFQTLFEYATEVKKLPAAVFRPKNSENWKDYFKEKEEGIEKGIDELLTHLKTGYYRSPHFGLGKNYIGDFVDWASTDLRKPFLHYLHKYKGKGDPRISRALINLLEVKEGNTILDPFVGSGAFIADAPTMGINAIGVEVLNIATLISTVKCNLNLNLEELRNQIIRLFILLDKERFILSEIKDEKSRGVKPRGGHASLRGRDLVSLREEKNALEVKLKNILGDTRLYQNIAKFLDKILLVKENIKGIRNDEIKKFFLVLLSQQIVEYSEKNRGYDFVNSFKSYVEDRYLILHATKKLAEILKVDFTKAQTKIVKGDATNLSMIKDNSIDGILTSPPYFDALDYIGNNKPSIIILGLNGDLTWESTKEIYEGKYRDEKTIQQILPFMVREGYSSIKLPESNIKLINLLHESGRIGKSKTVENYLKMMSLSFKECYRVLRPKKYYLMVISKYHTWIINGEEKIIDTSSVLADLGSSVGFKVVDVIEHGLSKADKGKIGVEDILVFQK